MTNAPADTIACAPAMLTANERAHLRDMAAAAPRGGRIVELGTFLGASSECLFAGAADRLTEDSPLLVYDAFRAQPYMSRLCPMPFREGESFRAYFDLFQRDRLGRMLVREGYIPGDAAPADCARIYPEQEPVALLFVDLAKSEAVHRSIARSFYPHAVQGASVVHQDFKFPTCSWLPLHMHALRQFFEPTQDVPGCTVTFECVSAPAIEQVDEALAGFPLRDAPSIDTAWDQTIAWLVDAGLSVTAPHMELARAFHLSSVGDPSRAERACREAARLAEAPGVDRSVLSFNAREMLRHLGDADHPAASFMQRWVQTLERRDADDLYGLLWRQVTERCRASGWRRVALFGAGQHARTLLEGGWPHGSLELVAVLDDAPGAAQVSAADARVISPDELDEPVDAVILCSECCEDALAHRAETVFAARGVPVVRVYTTAPSAQAACAGVSAA